MKIKIFSICAAAAIFAPMAALAAPTVGQPAIAVKTSDLDLSTVPGQTALAHRVRRAAGELCSIVGETDRLEAHLRFTACVKAASDQAMTTAMGPAAAQVAANR